MRVVVFLVLAVCLRFLLDVVVAVSQPLRWVGRNLLRLSDWAEIEYLLAVVDQKMKARK